MTKLDELTTKYPKLFGQFYGFECSDGWYHILDNAGSLITNHIKHERKLRATQLQYNRVLKRALAGDTAGLRWYLTEKWRTPFELEEAIKTNIWEAKFRDTVPKCTQVVAKQVKQKFGILRFYAEGGDRFTTGVIRMAEAMSSHTCDVCGNIGKASGGATGWIVTRCKEHQK